MPKIGLAACPVCARRHPLRPQPPRPIAGAGPGASREAFDGGSRACMLQAARRDVAGDAATKRYVRGAAVMDREVTVPPMVPTDDAFAISTRQVWYGRAYGARPAGRCPAVAYCSPRSTSAWSGRVMSASP